MASTYQNIPNDASSDVTLVSNAPALTIGHTGDTYTFGLDTSQLVADEAASVVQTFTAGETISALDVVYLDQVSGTILKAKRTSLVAASVIGIAKTSGIAGDPIQVLQYGILSDASFAFTPAALTFLSDLSKITETAPTSGYLTRLGRTINLNTILVFIESPADLGA